MSVTVVSCVYGTYRDFVPRWLEAIAILKPSPDKILVGADRHLDLWPANTETVVAECPWKHPQAFYLNLAISRVTTEWVWIVDIDDYAKHDGLSGLNMVAADVWQMGFNRSDGETYVPPQMSNADYLESDRNVYVAGSAIRIEAFRNIGGFRDVALQDWDLWRRLAKAGASVQTSGRTHFHYMRHARTRGETELTLDVRAEHVAEMGGMHAVA